MLKKPKSISINPGVYLFRRGNSPLYIGKAANLKKRLASYFQKRTALPVKIQMMLEEARRLETIPTSSEVEALIREAELIKKYRPKYNLLMRDDKSYFYVAISRDAFPKIFITHQPKKIQNSKFKAQSYRYIGPFTTGGALKSTLKLLRRVFPYCTCTKPHRRACLSSQIGRCPGYCCAAQVQNSKRTIQDYRREYRKNVRNVVAVLEGKRIRLMNRLNREMKEAVRHERYEKAASLRDAILGLKDVFAHRSVLHAPEARYSWPMILGKLETLLRTTRAIHRVEGYDISNISGAEATGSMVVFRNGQPDKSQYRKFRIKAVAGISDVDMLTEVLTRRFRHSEWPEPDLVVIDGGKPQLNAALKALRESRIWHLESRRPIVTALAKREEILFAAAGRSMFLKREHPAVLHFFQRIRDESHRFARAYHHRLRRRSYAEAR